MSSFLANAMTWLSARHAGGWVSVPIVYRRGDHSVATVANVPGSTLLHTTDSGGHVKVQRTDRDFVLTQVADFAGTINLPPERDDVIDLTLGGVTKRYQLLPYSAGETEYYWSDGYENMIRVRTKYQGIV